MDWGRVELLVAGGIWVVALLAVMVAILLDLEDWFDHWENRK
jgi:hypothetical protein